MFLTVNCIDMRLTTGILCDFTEHGIIIFLSKNNLYTCYSGIKGFLLLERDH